MDYYNALIAEKENNTVQQAVQSDGKLQTISGTGEASVQDIAILNDKGERIEVIDVGCSVTLKITVIIHQPIPRLVLGYMIKDRLGQVIFGTNTHIKKQAIEKLTPGDILTYQFHFAVNVGPGTYSIATALVSTDTHLENNYEWRDLALLFTVLNINHDYFIGNCWLDPTLDIQR
jgi:lipopolysaccharide transport system ATP-binding protein